MVGTRCALSQAGKRGMSYDHDRVGDVIGQSKDGTCWRVRWDGRKKRSIDTLHKDFIVLLGD